MNILGIESTCDETAAAVVKDGHEVLSSVVASQTDFHRQYGGVVPEVAARSHIEVVIPVIKEALAQSRCTWKDVDAIAVANQPGLIGSLLIGVLTAKTLATLRNKPLIPVNHVIAHTYGAYLGLIRPVFPTISLTISGSHTHILLIKSHDQIEVIGSSRDDAAGEAFDKTARILGLGFPGGPAIDRAAQKGSVIYEVARATLPNSYDFSFSGPKTSVLRLAQKLAGGDFRLSSLEIPDRLTERQKNDIAASFQHSVCLTLVSQLQKAIREHHPKQIIVAGGVAANGYLRSLLEVKIGQDVILPEFKYCTDNAAMIAGYAFFHTKLTAKVPELLTPNPSFQI